VAQSLGRSQAFSVDHWVSCRLKITLPDPVMAQLGALAAISEEPASRVAAQMVRERLAQTSSKGPPRRRRLAPAQVLLKELPDEADTPGRPSWLEPYGGNREWRSRMWGAIVALHGRYPRQLENLKDAWWESQAHVETLCAIAVWRQSIDDFGRDPREELAFQIQLADYGHTLRQESGGVSRVWTPGAPPDDWTR
jgi:hypothetical protein